MEEKHMRIWRYLQNCKGRDKALTAGRIALCPGSRRAVFRMTRRRRKKFYPLILVILTTIAICIIHIQPYPPHPPPGAGGLPLALLDPKKWNWPGEAYECIEYTVGRGDTLWAIAERYYPNKDPRKVVWAIRRTNNLEGPEGPVLRPGQRIWIPDPALYGVGQVQLAAGSKK